jgi:predicted Zn-dependent peptidase
MYKKTVLKNGLRIITIPMKETRAVTFLAAVGVGWRYEAKAISGISHFLEHMFLKGTKKRPDKMEIIEPLDRVGAISNASTSEEATCLYTKVGYKYFDIAVDIISDVLLNPKFEQKEIDKERGVIVEEINMFEDHPMKLPGMEDRWSELLYGDQPAGRSGLGTKETISKFKSAHFFDYFNEHYLASNTVICVAGKIDEKKAINKIKKYFEDIRTGKPKGKGKVIEKQERPKSLIYFKETDQSHIFLGVRGYNLFNPKRHSQLVLATILGGLMSSRLFISVREEKGLAYYISTFSSSDTDTGYLATWAGIRNDNIEEAIKLILKEYKSLKEKKVSKLELDKAKDNLKGKTILSMESSDAQASFYAGQELLTGKILTLKEKLAQIDAVSTEDIQKTAKSIFRPEKLNLVLVGPFKDKKKFDKLLKV